MKKELITEEWLKNNGFKWHQLERQPAKHWVLWLGSVLNTAMASPDDLGIEIASKGSDDQWNCWLRSDTAGRYHRFIHVRYLQKTQEVIDLVTAITGSIWCPTNHLYGMVYSGEVAAKIRKEHERMDLQLLAERHKWLEVEKDESRGRALPEHMEAVVKMQSQEK